MIGDDVKREFEAGCWRAALALVIVVAAVFVGWYVVTRAALLVIQVQANSQAISDMHKRIDRVNERIDIVRERIGLENFHPDMPPVNGQPDPDDPRVMTFGPVNGRYPDGQFEIRSEPLENLK